jgi:hypothetical protein
MNTDKKDILILTYLLSYYKKKVKKQNDFIYQFDCKKTDMVTSIGIPKSSLYLKLKRLEEGGYIEYTGGLNSQKETTTLWWLDIKRIKADFGIGLSTTVKDKNVTGSEVQYTPVSPTPETVKGTFPDKKHGSNTPDQTTNTVFDWDSLPEPEKWLFKGYKDIESLSERMKEFERKKFLITNADVKMYAFNIAYPPTRK